MTHFAVFRVEEDFVIEPIDPPLDSTSGVRLTRDELTSLLRQIHLVLAKDVVHA